MIELFHGFEMTMPSKVPYFYEFRYKMQMMDNLDENFKKLIILICFDG